jgi:hypothetical protein
VSLRGVSSNLSPTAFETFIRKFCDFSDLNMPFFLVRCCGTSQHNLATAGRDFYRAITQPSAGWHRVFSDRPPPCQLLKTSRP